MARQLDLQLLTLTGIAHRCARETELFFQRQDYDPRYCFELFRRAIVERSQQAWDLVYNQYRPLVIGWVERHSAFPTSGEEAQYFVNRAFEKMWAALSPEKLRHFSNLKSLLRYLQICVHSVIIDQVRVAEQAIVGSETEISSAASKQQGPTVEDQALAQVNQQDFWEQVESRLHNEKEHRVVYSSFALELKPKEIYAHSGEMFHSVNEIYRIKENVLARLSRDPTLKKFFDENT